MKGLHSALVTKGGGLVGGVGGGGGGGQGVSLLPLRLRYSCCAKHCICIIRCHVAQCSQVSEVTWS